MKPTCYIETSIVSYLVARPSLDILVAGHQQITQEWWETIQPQMNCLISPFVVEEISKGDSKAAKRRLDAVSPFSILQVNEDIKELAKTYFTGLKLPEKAKLDASHLATAVWYQLDYLLSWNCKHIVSARVRKMLQEINAQENLPTPILCTPEELMEI